MLILKIKEVFIPSSISKTGNLDNILNPVYIGFRAEVIQEIARDNNEIASSRFVGIEYIIIERATAETGRIFREDIVSASKKLLTQGLYTSAWEAWKKSPKTLINNSTTPIINPNPLL